jgi:antirestriction protein ArdC
MVEGVNGLLKPYQIVTDRIITMLEQGTVPWHKPWGIDGQPKSLASGKAYRGINIFMLNCVAQAAGYKSSWWLTFNQVKERGGTVRKGEHSTPVVFWKILERETEIADSDESSIRKIPMLRYFQVFNVEQCDGIEHPKPQLIERTFDPIIACEQLIAGVPNPPEIRHGGSQAFYRPSQDLLNMPERKLFESPEEYYCTLFHELIHSTGHEKRLARESLKEMAPFGSPSYSREELIAEMGAAFLCNRAGIDQVTIANSAAYIQGWLSKLRADPKAVVLAASAAQRACDYLVSDRETGLTAEQVNAVASRELQGR